MKEEEEKEKDIFYSRLFSISGICKAYLNDRSAEKYLCAKEDEEEEEEEVTWLLVFNVEADGTVISR